MGGEWTLGQPWSGCTVTFCSRHRQTILPKHLPLSLAHQYSSTTSLIRFSVWFLSSILSLSMSSSSANLLHLPLSSTRSPSPSTTVSTFPLSNFSSKSLAFASGSTGSGPTLPWTGFAGVFMCYKHRQKRWFQTFIQGPTTGFVMLTSCSCCSSLTKCLSRWCAAMLTSGWENPS